MGLQSQQIVGLATQIAKVPGFTVQAGQLLNLILQELCQKHDFRENRKTTTFSLTVATGGGPYTGPSDYLRSRLGDAWISGATPSFVYYSDLCEYDAFIRLLTTAGTPVRFWVDGSTAPVSFFVYPPPSTNMTMNLRYYAQMNDITTPETSTTVPWFPEQTYLVTRLAGELMKISGDERTGMFLGNGDGSNGGVRGAEYILSEFLKMREHDYDNMRKHMNLDRARSLAVQAGISPEKLLDLGS